MPRQSEHGEASGRPRCDASTGAILRAALALVAERGFHLTSLDEIVARAGSSKPTIYRRWSSKSELFADAVRFALRAANPGPPGTGDVVEDVRIILKSTARAVANTPLGGALRAVVGVADGDRELARVTREIDEDRRQLLREVLAPSPKQAQRLTDLDVDRLLGAIYFRFLVRRLPIGPSFIDELVDRHFVKPAEPAPRRKRRR